MKSSCRAAAFCAALAGGLLAGRGDDAKPIVLTPANSVSMLPPSSVVTLPTPIMSGGPVEVDTDPEAVIQHSAEAREEFMRQKAEDANDVEARHQAYNDDWMLRGYSEQLNADNIGTSADRAAAAAGQVADSTHPQVDPLLAPETPAAPPAKQARPSDDAPPEAPAANVLAPLYLAPLLPAIGSDTPKGTTRLDAWGSTTTFDPISSPGVGLLAPVSHGLEAAPDTTTDSELDVPGLTAQRQEIGDPGGIGLSDSQTETGIENGGNRVHDDFMLPTAASNNSADFFRRQSEALAAPNASARAPLALPLSRPLSSPDSTALPKMHPTIGLRTHVDDPFDIIGGHRGD